MTCTNKDIQELIPDYAGQTLDQGSEALVARHLAGCEDCALELALLRAMASEPVPDPGEAFWAALPGRVYREVREQRQRGSSRWLPGFLERFILPRWVIAAAAVLLVVSLAWFLAPPVPLKMAETGSPDSGASYEDMLDSGQVELADLSGTELDSIDSWASGELATLLDAAADLPSNGQDLSIDDKLAELNTQELEQLSKKLDEYKEEG
jgi:anti-sigma factor RsiW